MANQDRQIGPPPRWGESIVHPRRRANLAAAHRGAGWGDGHYLAAYRRLLARHRRLIKRVVIGCGGLVGLLVLGWSPRSRKISAAESGWRLAARRSSAPPTAVPPCVFATSSCAIPTAPWSQARPKRNSAFPA